jgi:hypothetical protein
MNPTENCKSTQMLRKGKKIRIHWIILVIKQDRCLFFFSPWHYLSLFDLRLHARPLVSSHFSFIQLKYIRLPVFDTNLRIEQHEPHCKLRVNSDAPEGQKVPNPLVNTRYLNRPMICWIFNVIGEQGCLSTVNYIYKPCITFINRVNRVLRLLTVYCMH